MAPAGLLIDRFATLGPEVEPLRREGERDGVDFIRRLFSEWASGANRFDRPGETLLGVRHDDRLVGLGGLNRDPYTREEDVGRLRHVYVLGSHRRLGVGTVLVRYLLQQAADHFRVVRLRAASPESAAFYRRLGFAQCDELAATHFIRVSPIPSPTTPCLPRPAP